jgi:hypothetical protein
MQRNPAPSSIADFLQSTIDPRATPLLRRLAKLDAWPEPARVLRFALVCLAASTLLSAGTVWGITLLEHAHVSATRWGTISAVLRPISLLLVTIPPLIVAGAAATLAARDAHSNMLSLLRLTNLSAGSLYRGYVLAVLTRFRVLLISTAALVPMYAIAWASTLAAQNILALGRFHVSPADWVLRSASYFGLFAGLWSFNLLGTLIGVALGLRIRSISAALSASLSVSALLVTVWLAASLSLLPVLIQPLVITSAPGQWTRTIIVLIAACIPCAITALILASPRFMPRRAFVIR